MILVADDQRERLFANGRERSADHMPVVKFFNPLGEGVWLATELDADDETLFGSCGVQHKPNYVELKITSRWPSDLQPLIVKGSDRFT